MTDSNINDPLSLCAALYINCSLLIDYLSQTNSKSNLVNDWNLQAHLKVGNQSWSLYVPAIMCCVCNLELMG